MFRHEEALVDESRHRRSRIQDALSGSTLAASEDWEPIPGRDERQRTGDRIYQRYRHRSSKLTSKLKNADRARYEENENEFETVSDAGSSTTTGSESQEHKFETRSDVSGDTEDFAWLPRRFEPVPRSEDASTMTPSLGDGSSVTDSAGTITPTGDATPTMQPSEPCNLPILDPSHVSDFDIGPSHTGKLPAGNDHIRRNNLVFVTENKPDDFKSKSVMAQVRKKAMESYLQNDTKPKTPPQIQEQNSDQLTQRLVKPVTDSRPEQPEGIKVSPDDDHGSSKSESISQSINKPSHRYSAQPIHRPVSQITDQGPIQPENLGPVRTHDGSEIRLRIDASAPLTIQFNGDMNGRSLQLVQLEDGGMAELVIGQRREHRKEDMSDRLKSRRNERDTVDVLSSSRRILGSRRRQLENLSASASGISRERIVRDESPPKIVIEEHSSKVKSRSRKSWSSRSYRSGTSVGTSIGSDTDDTDYTSYSDAGSIESRRGDRKMHRGKPLANEMPALEEEDSDELDFEADTEADNERTNTTGNRAPDDTLTSGRRKAPIRTTKRSVSERRELLELSLARLEQRAHTPSSDNAQLQQKIESLKTEMSVHHLLVGAAAVDGNETREEISNGENVESLDTTATKPQEDALTPHLLPQQVTLSGDGWKDIRSKLPESWMWDVDYHKVHQGVGADHGCWTCTPAEPDEPKNFPLTISGAPVVLPVEYRWPPIGGVNPPPDPRPSAPIDCTAELQLDTIRDLFLTFEGSIGFYLLINGVLQIIVSDDFDAAWASSHLPHKYGGLRVSYIQQSMEPTMHPSKTDTMSSKESTSSQQSRFSSLFGQSRPASALFGHTLRLNDFIEARTKSIHKKEKFSGRIGLNITKGDQAYLVMSSHIITEAILSKSHIASMFSRRERCERLDNDWNDQVEIWAKNEKVGIIDRTFDNEAEIYPEGFRHDITLVKPANPATVNDIKSPISDLGWLSKEGWHCLRQRSNAVRILGDTESHRAAKTFKSSRPSDVLIVGEGIFLNQASSKPTRDHDRAVWTDLISRAVLYRVYPDFDPPNGYSGIALYADGLREDGTTGPGVVGFQSFVQRSGHVQNFEMEGGALEKRLAMGRVAFYGAFQVPETLRKEYRIV